MGFTTIKAGFTVAQTDGDGLRPVTGSPTQAQWEGTFKDIMQAVLYETLSGVLEGGVCTVTGLNFGVPINTVYVAGAMVWKTLVGETKAATDNATNYLWGCADGELRVTSTTTPPTGFESGKSCILVKGTAVAGVVTLDHTAQQRARTADHTNRTIRGGGIHLGNGAGQQRGLAAVSYASNANKTLTSAEYECMTINVGSGTTLTATRNLVFPLTAGAWWFVNNQSTGGQSIQCIGATGTGTTIATAKGAWVWSDGVNLKRGSADVTV